MSVFRQRRAYRAGAAIVLSLCVAGLTACNKETSNSRWPSFGGSHGGPVSSTGYSVSGTVTGLAGSGLVLQLNGSSNIAISSNFNFTFSTLIASGDPYAVTVLTQPTSPAQTCTVSGGSGIGNNGAGLMGNANVTNIIVNCVTNIGSTSRAIRANVSGWSGTGTAPVLLLNGSNSLSVANGLNTFGSALTDGSAYAVTVSSHPTGPSQTCSVTNGTGIVSGADVTVTVTCAANTYAIGGNVSGLSGSGLQLQLSGGEMLSVTGNGGFAFTTALADGSPYTASVRTQPSSPSQTCSIANASGTVSGAAVGNIQVSCVTNTFNVSVTVSGLSGSGLVLRNNGSDDLAAASDGGYTFATAVASGAGYAVTVQTQPSSPSQICTVANGSGTVGNGNVNNVAVNCSTNTYSVGGSVSGLTGGGLVLQLNGGNDLSVAAGSTAFTFASAIADGSSYNVTVLAQPTAQTCTVSDGAGVLNGANVTSVALSCGPTSWSGSRQLGTSSDDVGNAIAVDASGNIIVAGCLSGALLNNHSNYKATCDTVGGTASSLVRKYNAVGTLQWSRQLSNGQNVEPNAVVTDAGGNVYVTGFVSGALDGQAELGSKDIFLTKYSASGNRLWTFQFGSEVNDQGNAIAIDASGNIYIVGTTFGNLDGSSAGNNYDVFVARFDAASLASSTTPPTGVTWLVQFGTSATDYGLGIAADASGNLFVSGLTLGTMGSSAFGSEDAFLAKLAANSGNRSWIQQIGSAGYDYNTGVALDASGNAYIAGYTTGFSGAGLYDAFVASYDTHGTQRWLQQLVSAGHDYTTGIAVSGGNVYVAGYSVGNFDGNANVDASGNTTDIFVVQYDTSGNKQWSRTLGTVTDERPFAITTDASDNAYLTGYTLGDLDGGASNGGADMFILKYSSAGVKQ